jgi:hypothetical protein
MISKELMKVHMLQAMDREENRYKNGDYNWDFIDADVYMELYGEVDSELRDNETFYKYFDELAYELRFHEIVTMTKLHMIEPTGVFH